MTDYESPYKDKIRALSDLQMGSIVSMQPAKLRQLQQDYTLDERGILRYQNRVVIPTTVDDKYVKAAIKSVHSDELAHL